MDGYLRSAAVELYTAYNMVNHALSSRVQETTDVKNKLQERLLKVLFRHTSHRDVRLLKSACIDLDETFVSTDVGM